MGTVKYYDPNYDWALIEADGVTFNTYIKFPNGGTRGIDSWFTKRGIEYLAGNENEEVSKIGVSTGKTSGHVGNSLTVDVTEECQSFHGIEVSTRTALGDSGGPIFQELSDGEVILAGMLNVGKYKDGKECGNQAYKVAESLPQYKLDNKFGIQPVTT